MEELLNIIGNLGFPIAVSIYLLIRVETQLGKLTIAICELREAIITLPHENYWMPPVTLTPHPSNNNSSAQ